MAYTLGSVSVPSLASVYNEFALKQHMDTSVHEQNFFLYFYGACFNLLGVFGVMAFARLSCADVFRGHSAVRQQPPLLPAACPHVPACVCKPAAEIFCSKVMPASGHSRGCEHAIVSFVLEVHAHAKAAEGIRHETGW
jgi:hypothetical protein